MLLVLRIYLFIYKGIYIFLNDENYDNHNSPEVDDNNIIFSMAIDKPVILSYHTIIWTLVTHLF